MDGELVNHNHQSGILGRLIPVVGPGLLIAIGYVDPGKWAATVEGGACFGFDLLVPVLIFSFAAILCQYLSARIGVVTGRDLAQICCAEYDSWTCMFLGLQTAMSVIALDITMIVGIAHRLSLLFGAELSTCVFLAAVDAVLFPLFASLLKRCRAKFFCASIAGVVLLFYFLGVLISQPETPFSMNGMVTKLSVESLFALMSLLGANVMPHNFYVHSTLVLEHQGLPNVSKDALCLDHFFAILCIFSGIYLVNYVLINSAATVFHGTGLVLLTFTDAMSLMDQVFRNPLAPFVLLLMLYLTSQITALTWNLGGRVVFHDFLRLDMPDWLERATIRVIAIVPALYCAWICEAEGIYQLLIFTQVIVALLLPSSVIPLFRVASSRQIMGDYKISQPLEFLAVMTLLGMLILKIIFVVELIFGQSDWVGNLRWNMSSTTVPYALLLITACSSFCMMIWLAAMPLKSATLLDAQVWSWDAQKAIPQSSSKRKEEFLGGRCSGDGQIQWQEQLRTPDKPIEIYSDVTVANAAAALPETIMESDKESCLTTTEENHSIALHYSPKADAMSESTAVNVVADNNFLDAKPDKAKLEVVEKTVGTERDLHAQKDEEDGDSWVTEESSKEVSGSTSSLKSDGPGSYRSLSGKGDDSGSGTASLSRLAGLGRAARRQLAAVLDEFWGQLFDLHGQVTQEAKNKKQDALWTDLNPASSALKVDTSGKEFGAYLSPVSGRGSDSLMNSSLCNSPEQLRIRNNIDASYGVQRGSSSLWSNQVQLLDAYVQGSSRNLMDPTERRYSSVRTLPSADVPGSSHNTMESDERRYSSMRTLPSFDAWDYQPATVHGYQMGSIVNRTARDRSSSSLNGQTYSHGSMSLSLGSRSYRDPLSVALGQKQQMGLSSLQPTVLQNPAVSRNSVLLAERQYQDVHSSGSAENAGAGTQTKKYHSLPDIAGLSGPYRDLYMGAKSTQWDSCVGYGSAIGSASYDPSLYSTGSGLGGSLAFNGLSRGYGDAFKSLSLSKGYGDTFSFNATPGYGSLWSQKPFEQFGVADKSYAVEGAVLTRSNSVASEATSPVDPESQLLQSFRRCVLKLLKLEGSDWLFGQSDGADEELIERVAARERYIYEAETREISHISQMSEPHNLYTDRKSVSGLKNDEAGVFSVPHCGEGCVWRGDLIVSFGVWCIHRILDLSLMESRPELWGKYTYVLNRLQGVIDLAFSKPRSPMSPCFCLQVPATNQQRSSPPSNGMLPPAAKPARGKCTTAAMLVDLVKDVEVAISCRKGRSGTAAGDVAFPKGKENLASVLKRYKRRLSTKPSGSK